MSNRFILLLKEFVSITFGAVLAAATIYFFMLPSHVAVGSASALGMVLSNFIPITSAFCYDTKIVILSVLGTYFGGMIVDHFIFGMNIKRRVCVISPKIDEITDFVLYQLHSGATLNEITGAYHRNKQQEIIFFYFCCNFHGLL